MRNYEPIRYYGQKMQADTERHHSRAKDCYSPKYYYHTITTFNYAGGKMPIRVAYEVRIMKERCFVRRLRMAYLHNVHRNELKYDHVLPF
jgi:hypothetical protein